MALGGPGRSGLVYDSSNITRSRILLTTSKQSPMQIYMHATLAKQIWYRGTRSAWCGGEVARSTHVECARNGEPMKWNQY